MYYYTTYYTTYSRDIFPRQLQTGLDAVMLLPMTQQTLLYIA